MRNGDFVKRRRGLTSLTSRGGGSGWESSMIIGANGMRFASMLTARFIGARTRAVNGPPQEWAQDCFYMCTYAVLTQVLNSIAVRLVLSGMAGKGGVEAEMVYKVEDKVGTVLSVGRYIIMFCIFSKM